ncbi:metalloregulator ArsR/SmtB family transcription factor [Shewanella sp. JM162201]|uniref:Metalloregulator ArsR/SmtB family transcription factor n=1 Tax=Shewanella jiangmenensis TaxID=2837387 RepID=A0ABS5V2R8_9GAMM|nr:metalloregulator ArsR/SmtB family transcription factor [Shewanella jiangmenensis]MBT1443974.1 metalloregulator ArsR/SmtB family transcription factor [Shewanella jiangmenensis]
MDVVGFFKALADDTRLRILMLIIGETELCVCELTEALGLSQPKISRHLRLLKDAGLLQDRRQGQWVYYRQADSLPEWCAGQLSHLANKGPDWLQGEKKRLSAMGCRPGRCC